MLTAPGAFDGFLTVSGLAYRESDARLAVIRSADQPWERPPWRADHSGLHNGSQVRVLPRELPRSTCRTMSEAFALHFTLVDSTARLTNYDSNSADYFRRGS